MARYLLLRLGDAIPTLFLVLTLVFIAMRILPGDPALAALGDGALPEQLADFRERMGLNVPLWQQYFNFLGGVLTLDFGRSLLTNTPVLQLIGQNLPYTIELTLAAMLMGIVAGIPLGVMAATNRNKAPDGGMRIFSLIGYAIPDFFLGAILLITFALNLGWFPINGAGSDFVSRLHHLFLPALTLAFVKAAFLGRLTRTSLLEVLGKDYVRTARAKGLSEWLVLFRHALRNAAIPILTVIGGSFAMLISGVVVTESVFNIPGLGRLVIDAVLARDYPVIQAIILLTSGVYVVINLLIDLSYALTDPRIRY